MATATVSVRRGLAAEPLYCFTTAFSEKEIFSGNFQLSRDGKFLHAIKTLETINDKPVADFWKEMNPP